MKAWIATIATLLFAFNSNAGTLHILVPHPAPTGPEQRYMAMHSFCISTATETYKFNDIWSRDNEGWKRVSLGDGMSLPIKYVGEWRAYLPEGEQVMAVIHGETTIIPMKIAHSCLVRLRDSQ
ncbi:hypothetical protein ABRZ03_02300 [Castellaniella ginsengisoli]|uniref:Uncharacterized protein n=1 Tax=Castellaniella ginsengisoli TaxID=546114 RepID=A0AB39EBA7_9BURK